MMLEEGALMIVARISGAELVFVNVVR